MTTIYIDNVLSTTGQEQYDLEIAEIEAEFPDMNIKTLSDNCLFALACQVLQDTYSSVISTDNATFIKIN